MKRSAVIVLMIVAFALSTAASLSAAPRISSAADQSQNWVGKTTNDLLLQIGVPSYTTPNDNGGMTIDYVGPPGSWAVDAIGLVQQLEVLFSRSRKRRLRTR